ncbi:MAG: ABC transporter ATP-binding protein [Pseudomonadales bacterium]
MSPERPAPALAIRGISKRYPGTGRDAVHDVELTLNHGEVVAVVGQSGCGKTTLLRIVAGLEVPDRGRVEVDGRTLVDAGVWVPPERRGIGLVFQEFALFPHLTVEQNVAYGLHHLPRAERRARTGDMLSLVELAGLEGRYPHQLSGGQQQRVALARALAPAPKLLLLDEPFSNLDTPLKATVRAQLAGLLRQAGVPALLVVHDVEDVMALADRVAVLREGRIVREGAPHELRDAPGDTYVARFFDTVRA